MRTLENLDWIILYFVNGSHTPFWDSFNQIITDKYNWIPLYLALFVVFIIKLGWKNGLLVIAGAVVCYLLTEMISAKILKPFFARPRPCHQVGGLELWLPNKCGGPYGFVSTHAANTMGLAIFCIRVFTKKIKGRISGIFAIILLMYAFFNGFSRIYLGVHFPSDVICGALLGLILALLTYFVFEKFVFRDNKSNEKTNNKKSNPNSAN